MGKNKTGRNYSTVEKYNWRDYEVLLSSNFSERDVRTDVVNNSRKSNKYVEKVVEYSWADMLKGRASVGKETWESEIYCLSDFSLENGLLHLKVFEDSFRVLQGTNATNWILGDIFGYGCLANSILVQSLVFTSDDKVILGRRNTGVKEEYEPYAIVGGTVDKTNEEGELIEGGWNIFKAMRAELWEELGVSAEHTDSLSVRFLIRDWKHYPIFYFYTELNLSSVELAERFKKFGDKREHSRLEFFDKDEISGLSVKREENIKDLTLIGLDLLANES